MKLMRDCQEGKVDYILTKPTSRFARNTVDSLTWIRKLRAIGIGVYFEEQNLDSSKVRRLAECIQVRGKEKNHRYFECWLSSRRRTEKKRRIKSKKVQEIAIFLELF